ncbi:hypothetical protein MKX01_033720 [Papaver californicum]|nr:hypothetical protein MKX01_033720 [Papaver californicum]
MAGIKKSGVCYTSAALFLIPMTLGAESSQPDHSLVPRILLILTSVHHSFFPGKVLLRLHPLLNAAAPLQRVDQTCICNTLRIAARIPRACNLPALTCGTLVKYYFNFILFYFILFLKHSVYTLTTPVISYVRENCLLEYSLYVHIVLKSFD